MGDKVGCRKKRVFRVRWDALYASPFFEHPLAAIVLFRVCGAICDTEKPPCLRAARARAYTPEEEAAFDALLTSGVLLLNAEGRVVVNESERTPLVSIGSFYPPKDRLAVKPNKRFRVLERDGFKCVYCGVHASDAVLQVDHVMPVVRGGTNDLSNLVTACVTCNIGKHARELQEPLQ